MNRVHLLSCSKCPRQLDVTALEVGDVVQCVCDAVLTVPVPRKVTIRGLECRRCGGAVGEGDTTCSFCSAALSKEDRRETLICPVCAVRLADDSHHCKKCGVELRATALPPLPKDGKCPRCQGELRVHLMEDAEVIECSPDTGCGGLWCSRETFERMQRKSMHLAGPSRAEPNVVEPVEATGGSGDTNRQYLPCLVCNDLMQRRQFRIAGRGTGIVLDVCGHHGVWFDERELEATLAHVRQRYAVGEPLFSPGKNLPVPGTGWIATDNKKKQSKWSRLAGDAMRESLDVVAAIFTWSLFD